MAIEKRFPSDFRDWEDTKTMFSDSKVDMQLYNFLQCNSMPYPIKDENDNIIEYETRVYKKDIPTQEVLAEMFGVSTRTIKRSWAYLLNSSETNRFCPYLEKRKDNKGVYYIILSKEEYYIKVPLEICKYLNSGYSELAIRLYSYLFARDKFVKDLGGDHYFFTLMGLAKRLGISDKAQKNVWSWPDGTIPQALMALQFGKLITFERREKNHRPYYVLMSITKDLTQIKASLPKIQKASPKDERDIKISEIVDIIDNGAPDYDKKIHAQKAHDAMKRIEAWASQDYRF